MMFTSVLLLFLGVYAQGSFVSNAQICEERDTVFPVIDTYEGTSLYINAVVQQSVKPSEELLVKNQGLKTIYEIFSNITLPNGNEKISKDRLYCSPDRSARAIRCRMQLCTFETAEQTRLHFAKEYLKKLDRMMADKVVKEKKLSGNLDEKQNGTQKSKSVSKRGSDKRKNDYSEADVLILLFCFIQAMCLLIDIRIYQQNERAIQDVPIQELEINKAGDENAIEAKDDTQDKTESDNDDSENSFEIIAQ